MNQFFLICFFTLVFNFLSFGQDPNYSEWYLIRDDVEIFVKEMGRGQDTVLVLHGGFGANHDYMIDAIDGLEDQFHFVFFDQRGSLMSPADKENLTFQKNVDDVEALIKTLGSERIKILAHSMGTLVAMEYVKQHPESVSHLVLTGTLLPKSDSLQSVFSERQNEQINFLMTRESAQTLRKPFVKKGADSLKTPEQIAASGLSHKDLTEYWRINFASVNLYHVGRYNSLKGGRIYYNPEAAVMGETVDWKYDYRLVMNSKFKTTIINGAYDFIDFNGDELRELLKGYENIQLKIIPKAGHNSWIDDPEMFKKYLLEGLEGGILR